MAAVETTAATLCASMAAGARPSVPRIEGADLPGVVTSDRLFADLPQSIGKLVIIGGGVSPRFLLAA